MLVEDGRIAELNAEEAVADKLRVVDGVVSIFNVGADFLDHHDMEDDFDQGEQYQEAHEIPEQIEIGRHSSSVVLEVLDNVPARPFTVLQLLKALAAGTASAFGIINSWFGTVIVQVGEGEIWRPFKRVVLGIH